MSDFKTKMHRIRFPLGLRSRPRWENLQRSPRPSSCILGGLILRDGTGKRERRGRGRERENKRRGEWREGDGPGPLPPNILA